MPRSWGQVAAKELRSELDLAPGRVDVFRVIEQLGIETYARPMPNDGLDGAHQLAEGQGFIFINSAHALTRQRFTAAHELGHHRHGLGEGPPVFEADIARLTDPTEVDINSFAAYFLMDPGNIAEAVEPIGDPLERVAATSSIFAVSPEAAAIQLAALGHVSRAFKSDVCRQLRQGELRPGDLYRQYGYQAVITPQAAKPEFDPRHVARAVQAYDLGLMSLVGLSDVLSVSADEAADILRQSDIDVLEEAERELSPAR